MEGLKVWCGVSVLTSPQVAYIDSILLCSLVIAGQPHQLHLLAEYEWELSAFTLPIHVYLFIAGAKKMYTYFSSSESKRFVDINVANCFKPRHLCLHLSRHTTHTHRSHASCEVIRRDRKGQSGSQLDSFIFTKVTPAVISDCNTRQVKGHRRSPTD